MYKGENEKAGIPLSPQMLIFHTKIWEALTKEAPPLPSIKTVHSFLFR